MYFHSLIELAEAHASNRSFPWREVQPDMFGTWAIDGCDYVKDVSERGGKIVGLHTCL